ncbi:MAG: TetR/AcrR family transcriptional regulator [Pseudomonadota bacterium]
MSPKIVDREQKRSEIALVALEIFADKGFEAASMSLVAERAGIGKGTIYEYFESKEELFACALEGWVQQAEGLAVPPTGMGADPEQNLRAYAQAAMHALIDDPRATRLFLAMFQLMIGEPEAVQHADLMNRLLAGPRQVVAEILREGVRQGQFRPDIAGDIDIIASNLLSYLDAMGLYFYIDHDQQKLTRHIDFHLHNLLRGLRAVDGATR